MLDTTTGEVVEVTLKHEGDNVREFYSSLPRPVRVGIEATGSMQWFLRQPDRRASAERIDWFAAYSRRIDALWDQNGANQDLPLEENGIYSNSLLSKVVHATSSTVLVSFASARSADSVHLAQY